MNKQDYRKAMNRIKISDSFQARTAQLMQEVRDGKASEPSEENTRIYSLENEKRRFPVYIKYGALIAAVAVISFSAGVLLDPRSADGIAEGSSDSSASAADDVVTNEADHDSGEERNVEAAGGYEYDMAEDAIEDNDEAAPVEGGSPVADAPPMSSEPQETANDTLGVTMQATLSESEQMRALLNSGDSIMGFAENCFYILAKDKVKAPLSESNSEHTELAEFPTELISMTADIMENTEPMENAVSPEEYAKDSDLYMPLNWNGTAFVFGFHNDDMSFAFTVCGRSVTSLNSGLSYALTEEDFLAYSDYSVQLVGGTLIPSANPAAGEESRTEQ